MDNPRLKFNNKEFGLRKLDNNTFELKSADIFSRYFDSEYVPEKHGYFFQENPITKIEPATYRKIESFCFVTTSNIRGEAAMLLKSLRKFHNEPVYIICDAMSKRYLTKLGLIDDNVYCRVQAEPEDLKSIDTEIFKNHKCIANNLHNAPAILKKMDVMEYALEHHENTFFLDSDIIVTDSLQEYFQAKVVLSPHFFPKRTIMNGYECGFYNAGYVFCASKGFPRMWRHMYLNDSTFFEQECMNRIPESCTIETFGRDHNIGFWREGIFPKTVKSFHCHITNGVDKNRNDRLKELNENIRNSAKEYLKTNHPDLYNFYLKIICPKKVAFVHYGKAAGVYINAYLKNICLKTYLKYFSYHADINPFQISGRDWTKDELIDIASTAKDYSFLTQHHIGYDLESIKKFKENGWFTFTFLRKPEELLCSLFNWSREKNIKLRPGVGANPTSIQETFEFALKYKGFSRLWKLPDYIDELDYVSEFNDTNFENFLLETFGELYEPQPKLNVSLNKGFKFYRDNNYITDEILDEFFSHPDYLKYKHYL